ncbi:MAG: dTDP-4-dehydrorhamnose 3,5-epimerase family protein [Candidatus Promineifilaceae bacterium]
MTTVEYVEEISGLQLVRLQGYGDDRGRFMETFRKEWFPQRSWDRVQINRSDSKKGVLRGLHYHHQQIDYWYVIEGVLLAAVVDIRPNSATYLNTITIEMGGENNIGLFIPSGVAHGFYAITDVTLTYVIDNYFDGGRDEYGVAWNDPQIGMDWGTVDPILSDRDRNNPLLRDIVEEDLP